MAVCGIMPVAAIYSAGIVDQHLHAGTIEAPLLYITQGASPASKTPAVRRKISSKLMSLMMDAYCCDVDRDDDGDS